MDVLRLTPREADAVRAKWCDNPIYKAFYDVCKSNVRFMKRLEYMPEEVFHAVFVVVDGVRNAKRRPKTYIQGLGDDVRDAIRGGLDVPDDEVWMAACEILSIAATVFTVWHCNNFNRTAMDLLNEIGADCAKTMAFQCKMIQPIPQDVKSDLAQFCNEYMESEREISKEIGKMLRALDEPYAKEKSMKERILEFVEPCGEFYIYGKRKHQKLWSDLVDKCADLRMSGRSGDVSFFEPMYDNDVFSKQRVLGVLGVLFEKGLYDAERKVIVDKMNGTGDNVETTARYIRYGLNKDENSKEAIEKMIDGLV